MTNQAKFQHDCLHRNPDPPVLHINPQAPQVSNALLHVTAHSAATLPWSTAEQDHKTPPQSCQRCQVERGVPGLSGMFPFRSVVYNYSIQLHLGVICVRYVAGIILESNKRFNL